MWTCQLRKTDLKRARKFTNSSCLTNHLTAINEQENLREVKKINIQLYCKRDCSPFSIDHMPHRTSNIP